LLAAGSLCRTAFADVPHRVAQKGNRRKDIVIVLVGYDGLEGAIKPLHMRYA